MKDITSIRHARRYAVSTEADWEAHKRECVTCSPGRLCSIATRVKENAERAAGILRDLLKERDALRK